MIMIEHWLELDLIWGRIWVGIDCVRSSWRSSYV